MARTMQTMRKSTGGRRPRSDDDDDSDAPPHTQTQKIKKDKRRESGSQNKGKRRALEESDESEAESSGDEHTNKKGKKGQLSDEERRQLVQAICRHVLFHEYNRRPLRREDITKTILTEGRGRHFNELLEKAQKVLKEVMGYELVQMRAKDGAPGKNPPKIYVLRSALAPALLRHAATADVPGLGPVAGTSAGGSRTEKMLRELNEWQQEKPATLVDHSQDEAGVYGLLGVVLALILVNGKVLGDDQLVSYLKRLNLAPSASTPISPLSAHPAPSLHALLLAFAKQGYLERNKSAMALAGATQMTQHQPTQRRKGRPTQHGADDEPVGGEAGDPAFEWRWGARAEIELGEKGVAKFIEEIYTAGEEVRVGGGEGEEGEGAEEDEEELRAAKAKKLRTEIARASGSKELQGVTLVGKKDKGKEKERE